MMKKNRAFPINLVLAVMLVAWVCLPHSAQAQTSRQLTQYISAQDKSVVGINVDALRKSKYFDQVLAWVKGTPSGQALFTAMDAAQVDLARDINTLVLGVADLTAQNEPGKSDMTFVMSGKLDQKKMLALLNENGMALAETTSGKLKLHTKDNLTVVFPKSGLMWGVVGSEAYRKRALETLQNNKNRVDGASYFKQLIDDTKNTRGLWAIVDMEAAQAALTETDPNRAAKSAAFSLDVASGMAMEVMLEMVTKDGAKSAADELRAQALEAGKNPMLAMSGASPLLKNLKVSHNGTRMVANSSMNSAEFDKLLKLAGQLVAAKLNGGAAPAQVKSPSKTPGDAPIAPAKKSKKGGAKADFN